MALSNYYKTIEVYREVSTVDGWGNTDESGNWILSHTVQGFLQPNSGSYSSSNQSNKMVYTHILYTDVGVDIVPGDNIKLNDNTYLVETTQYDGVSGMGKHDEIGCSLIIA